MSKHKCEDVSILNGKVLTGVTYIEERLLLNFGKEIFEMSHNQECCEEVYLETKLEDPFPLIGQKIVQAYSSTGDLSPEDFRRLSRNGGPLMK